MTALQSGQARTFTVKWDGGDGQFGERTDHGADTVRQTTGASRSHLHLAWVGLCIGKNILEGLPRFVLVGNDHHNAATKNIDWIKFGVVQITQT